MRCGRPGRRCRRRSGCRERRWSERARGRIAAADAALGELVRGYADDAAYQIAGAYADRGDAGHAFEWLERAYRQRDAGLASIRVDPVLRALHADPRWQALLERIGLAG